MSSSVTKNVRFYILVLIVFSTLTVSLCKPQDDEELDPDEIPKTCEQYLIHWVLGIVNSTLKCLGGQSYFKMNNIFELGTRASCLLKCTLQEEGIIGSDGKLDDIGAAFYFEESFAQEVRDIALPEAQACFDLANDFQPREYWCKTYLPFIECSIKAILKGLIPYGGSCVSNPIVGILFSVIKYIGPAAPLVTESMEELKRSIKRDKYKCLDKNCTRLYEYKKVNGSQAVILYNSDMEVITVDTRQTKPKPKNQQKRINSLSQ